MKGMSTPETLTRARNAFKIGEYQLVEKLSLKILEDQPEALVEIDPFLGRPLSWLAFALAAGEGPEAKPRDHLAEAVADQHDGDLPQAIDVPDGVDDGEHAGGV